MVKSSQIKQHHIVTAALYLSVIKEQSDELFLWYD